MFEKNQYVYHETGGICKIDDVRYAPLEGMPNDRLYYVLSPLQDRNSTIYVPVDASGVFLRALMERAEAEALMRSVSSIEPIDEPNAKLLRLKYIEAMRTHQPAEWVRVLKTVYGREQAKIGRARLSESERGFAENAKRNLATELGMVLGLDARAAECAVLDSIRVTEI